MKRERASAGPASRVVAQHLAPRPRDRRRGWAGSACAWAPRRRSAARRPAVLAIASGRSANSAAIVVGGLHPRLGRGAAAVGAVDIGRIGDAQHRVVRVVEAGLGEAGTGWSRPAAGRAHRRDRSAPPRPPPRSRRRAAPARYRADRRTAPAGGRHKRAAWSACPSASSRASAPSPAPRSARSGRRCALRARRAAHAHRPRSGDRDAPPTPARRDCRSRPRSAR